MSEVTIVPVTEQYTVVAEGDDSIVIVTNSVLNVGGGGGGGDAVWGSITGTLSDQTDLQTALDGKSNVGHTHTSANIIGFNESVDDRVANLLSPGSGVTLTYDDNANLLIIDSNASLFLEQDADSVKISAAGGSFADIQGATGSVAGVMLPADKAKLDGIEDGATANSPDATLLARANHTGTQTASTISDFSEAVDDRVAALIVPGSGITATYDDTANTLTISSTAPGSTNLSTSTTTTSVTINSDTGTDATIAAASGSAAGVLTAADKTKLDGIATGATANQTDAYLLSRANHTGTQAISTVTGLQTALDDKVDDSQISAFGLTLIDDADASAARSTLGLGTSAVLNVPASGNAASGEVVKGNDTRLTDARTPTAHTHTLADVTDVTISAANLNALDDGANTALHFHDADRARANHTGTQTASTISDFSEAVDDRVASLLVAGTNVTLTYNDGAGTLTIDAAGGGGGSGTVTSVDITAPAAGITASGGPITNSGSITLALADDLAAVEGLSGTGLAARTASNTWATRTISAGSSKVSITDGNGVSGNPTIDVTEANLTLGNIGGTLGETKGGTNQTTYATGDILYASGANTLAKRTIGSTGDVLTVAGGVPTWAAPAAGGGSVYYKDPVRVATTAAGTLASSFENGDAIDGVTLATGDRILIKNQASAAENGIYTVNASGAPTRATDMDANTEVQRGSLVYVQFGTVNGGSNWQVVSSSGTPIVVGSSTIVWGPLQGVIGQGMNAWTAPVASGTNGVAIGNGASATGTRGLALGTGASASNTNSIAISANTSAVSSGAGAVSINGGTVSGAGTLVIGGNPAGGTVSGASSIFIGRVNASGTFGSQSTYIGFLNGTNTSDYATAVGYSNNAGQTGALTLGSLAQADFSGEVAFATGGFAQSGDAQVGLSPLRIVTTNATPTEMATGNGQTSTTPTDRLAMTNNSTVLYDVDIVARKSTTGTDYAAWNLKFCINREAGSGTTALVGSVTKTQIGATAGASTWDVTATADTTNGRAKIEVTGQAATTIRWVASARTTKVRG